MVDGNLVLALRPILPATYFKDDNTVTFTFLKDIEVTYVNPDRLDTWRHDAAIVKYELVNHDETVLIDGAYINGKYAAKIREGLYHKIRVHITTLGGRK
jgi:hypothetical protein